MRTDPNGDAGITSLERLNLRDTLVTDLSPLLPLLQANGLPMIELPEGLGEEQRRVIIEATTIPPEEMKRIAPTGLTLVICNSNNEVLDTLVVKPDTESADYDFRIAEEQPEIRVFAVGSRIGKNYNHEGRTEDYFIARDQNHANAEVGLGFGESVDASVSGGELTGLTLTNTYVNEPRSLSLTQAMRNQIHADIVADQRTMPIFVEAEGDSPGEVTSVPVE